MLIHELANFVLTQAADAPTDTGVIGTLAKRFNDGGIGMYPITVCAIFFLAITPFGVVMRLLGKDPLRRRFEPGTASYWIVRTPPGPPPQSMSNQF